MSQPGLERREGIVCRGLLRVGCTVLALALPWAPLDAQELGVIDRFWSAAADGDSANVVQLLTPGAQIFEYHPGFDAFTPMDWAEFPVEYLELVWGFPDSDFSVEPLSVAENGPFVSRREAVDFVTREGDVSRSIRLATYLVRGGRLARIWLLPETPGERVDFGIRPRFRSGEAPLVLVDAGHENFHKSDGSFRGLAELARQDGLQIRDLVGPTTDEELSRADLLVVGNAMRGFTPDELEVLDSWIRSGGSLLLVSDHPPFSEASAPLARRLGFRPFLGRAVELPRSLPDFFSSADGTLRFPDGSAPDGVVVATMTGHAFRAPTEAVPLLTLEGDWIGTSEQGEERPLGGWLQGASLTLGEGRVVFLSEARVLADLSLHDNAVFARELLRWLVPADTLRWPPS